MVSEGSIASSATTSLLIVRTRQIFTTNCHRGTAGYSEFPAYSRLRTTTSPPWGAAPLTCRGTSYLRTVRLSLVSPRGRTISSRACETSLASGVWPLRMPLWESRPFLLIFCTVRFSLPIGVIDEYGTDTQTFQHIARFI